MSVYPTERELAAELDAHNSAIPRRFPYNVPSELTADEGAELDAIIAQGPSPWVQEVRATMTDEQVDREKLEAEVAAAIHDLNDEHLEGVLSIVIRILEVQNRPDPNDSDDG